MNQSLDVHHILLPYQRRKETKSTCEGLIDKVLLKGPQFKIKFWKTERASVTRDAQRLKLLFPARVIPAIKIYLFSLVKEISSLRPRLQHALLQMHINKVHDTLAMLWFYFNSAWIGNRVHWILFRLTFFSLGYRTRDSIYQTWFA